MTDECKHEKPTVKHPLCEISTLQGLDKSVMITVKAKTKKQVFELYKDVDKYMSDKQKGE